MQDVTNATEIQKITSLSIATIYRNLKNLNAKEITTEKREVNGLEKLILTHLKQLDNICVLIQSCLPELWQINYWKKAETYHVTVLRHLARLDYENS